MFQSFNPGARSKTLNDEKGGKSGQSDFLNFSLLQISPPRTSWLISESGFRPLPQRSRERGFNRSSRSTAALRSSR